MISTVIWPTGLSPLGSGTPHTVHVHVYHKERKGSNFDLDKRLKNFKIVSKDIICMVTLHTAMSIKFLTCRISSRMVLE
jgi:hypothetical protein